MLAAAAAAAGVALPVQAQEKKPGNANNRIRVAILGCRIRGKQHAQELAPLHDCEIAYVCDPDWDLANELAAAVAKQQGTAPKTAQDIPHIFDDHAVDAVFVAAPEHLEARASMWAIEGGEGV